MTKNIPHRCALTVAMLTSSAVLAAGPPTAIAVEPAPAHGGGARVIAEEHVGQRLVDLTIQSPALGATANVRLLTPDGWQQRRHGQRWPVLFLLHGMGDSHRTWTDDSDVEQLAALRDVLVVMPDAGESGYYTNWWNFGAGGPPRWETFHLDELRRILERGYGAGTRRAVAGLSMGGFGAVSYAARRPGMFRAAASYSGPVHLLHPRYVQLWEDAPPEAFVLWGHPVAQRPIWQAHDPHHLATRLRHTPIYLSSGDGTPGPLDPAGTPADEQEAMIDELNRSLAGRLRQVGAQYTTHFYAGTHSPPYWERELHRSLPMLLHALRR
jgi:diacylglycerol O-acyltransferase / trehalose O-mycolyltransferase